MVHQLVYGSVAVRPFREGELAELLQIAREKNRRSHITGMLLYYDQSFLQVLEGEQASVEALFLHIARDARHHGVTVFSRGDVAERSFGDWSMAFHALTSGEVAQYEGFQQIRTMTPGELGSPKIRALFAAFRRMTRLEMAI